MITDRGNRSKGRKICPSDTVCPPQSLNGQPWERNRASAVRSRQQTACPRYGPMFTLLNIIYIARTMICELSRHTRRKKAEGHLQQHSGHNKIKFDEASAHFS